MFISATEAKQAEREAQKQILSLAYLLRADPEKIASPSETMHVRRLMASASARLPAYDELLAEQTTTRLFAAGALFFARPGD